MKILHLYYDIMNLYGDYGNVSVLERLIAQSGTDCEVVKKSLGDDVDFNDYGFVFIGSGTEKNQKLVLEDFKRLADGFKAYVEADKPALLTGNSFEMLGKTITDCDGGEHSGLGMFDFTVTEQNKTRMTANAIQPPTIRDLGIFRRDTTKKYLSTLTAWFAFPSMILRLME